MTATRVVNTARNRKPWLACLCEVERDGINLPSCTKVLWYSKEPILAYQPKDVEKVVLTTALKELEAENFDPEMVEVYVTPFGFPTE